MRTVLSLVVVVMMMVSFSHATLPVGEKPVTINLSGDLGGKVDGTAWSSNEIRGKVWVLVNADPDESDLNNEATEALKAEDFPDDKYGSIAMINMDATWKPNVLIDIILKKKQEQYESTIYVRDMKKTVTKTWNLKDDSNNIVVFGQDGTVLFSVDGQLSKSDIEKMIDIIKNNL